MIINDDKIYIRYLEKDKGKSVERIFEKKPILLQFEPYPKDSQVIMRAHFKGTAPTWLQSHNRDYNFVKTTGDFGTGFALVKRLYNYENIMNSPILKGQLNELLEGATFDDEALREQFRSQLMDNFEIVQKNFEYFPEEFEVFELYYKPEELTGINGALYRHSKWSNCTSSNELEWHALIESLIALREYPEPIEEIQELEEIDVLPTQPIELDDEVLEEIPEEELEVLEPVESVEELIIDEIIDDLTQETESSSPECELVEEIIEELIDDAPLEEIEEIGEIEPSVDDVEDLKEEPAPVSDAAISVQLIELEVAESANRKEKILAGQTLLF